MAVLIEAISVVIRVEAIHSRYPGGWQSFSKVVPNNTLCSDNDLARVGFMTPEDARAFTERLEQIGIVFLRDGHCHDAVVIDQLRGILNPCDWVEYGHVELAQGQKISAAQMKGSEHRQVFCPDGWRYENSLSRNFGFVPTGKEKQSLRFLRREDGLDVYLNLLTGNEVFVARNASD